MLAATFATNSIVAEYMITVDIDIKLVALFPRFLNQPCTNIVLAHVIDQVFELGEMPEALGILGVHGGKIVFLIFVIGIVAHKFMGL